MKKLKFVHLSDTHILRNYGGTMLESLTESIGETPETLLKSAANWINTIRPEIDFAIISGDLVHEGEAADYEYFKELIRSCFGMTPVYLCIGNHDRRAAFNEGYLGEKSDKPYYYSTQHGTTGLRIIALDSSHDNSGKGCIDNQQLNWLNEELKSDSGGSLLIIHHPPYLNSDDPFMAAHSLINAKELHEVINGSDIFAILSGHTHQASASMFGQIPHYTADGTAFGVSIDSNFMSMNSRVGFSSCTVENRTISVNPVAFNAPAVSGIKIPLAQLIEHLQKSKS